MGDPNQCGTVPTPLSDYSSISGFPRLQLCSSKKSYLSAPMMETERELQLIIDRTPFMLTRCGADLRYRFVSPAYAEMLGRPAAEISGRAILDVIGEEGFATILPHIQKVLKGNIVEYETQVPFRGVGTRALHVIYSPETNLEVQSLDGLRLFAISPTANAPKTHSPKVSGASRYFFGSSIDYIVRNPRRCFTKRLWTQF